jgi:hypothetical protein
MSATGAGRPYLRAHHAAAINATWRAAAGNVYAGNSFASPTIARNRGGWARNQRLRAIDDEEVAALILARIIQQYGQ